MNRLYSKCPFIFISMYIVCRTSSPVTHLFMSQAYILPSNPDVTRSSALWAYSMFFTQLAWPFNVLTCETQTVLIKSYMFRYQSYFYRIVWTQNSSWMRNQKQYFTLCFMYRASHKHTVVSSEQVANIRESKNLQCI